MHASLHSVRIAPKKANLVAAMVRGRPVEEAIILLEGTHKKGARLLECVIKSAVANAVHNDRQSAATLVVKTIIVNQGTAYRRGVPMARGRVRPMRKFLSHITVTLGVLGADGKPAKAEKKATKTSARAKNPVQTSGTGRKRSTSKTSSATSGSADSAGSPS